MTSKERVRTALRHQKPDRIPAAFEAVGAVEKKLLQHYGFTHTEQLYEKFGIDIIPAARLYWPGTAEFCGYPGTYGTYLLLGISKR